MSETPNIKSKLLLYFYWKASGQVQVWTAFKKSLFAKAWKHVTAVLGSLRILEKAKIYLKQIKRVICLYAEQISSSGWASRCNKSKAESFHVATTPLSACRKAATKTTAFSLLVPCRQWNLFFLPGSHNSLGSRSDCSLMCVNAKKKNPHILTLSSLKLKVQVQ